MRIIACVCVFGPSGWILEHEVLTSPYGCPRQIGNGANHGWGDGIATRQSGAEYLSTRTLESSMMSHR